MAIGPYHTALRSGHLEPAEPRKRVVLEHGKAFAHDLLTQSLPTAYEACDVIYCDAPWPAGKAEFERRVGLNGDRPDWDTLMITFISQMLSLDVPLIFSTNRSTHPALPRPHARIPGRLNGAHCMFWTWNTSFPGGMNSVDLIERLAGQHRCVGDPFCGYGRTGRIFAQRGKRFVMSDLNPSCIGYIAKAAPSWSAPILTA